MSNDDFEYYEKHLSPEEQNKADDLILDSLNLKDKYPILRINELAAALMDCSIKVGFAKAACMSPYPPSEAMRDLRYYSSYSESLRRLIGNSVSEEISGNFKQAQQSSKNLLLAALAGSGITTKDPDERSAIKNLFESIDKSNH